MSRWGNTYLIGLTGKSAVGTAVLRQMLQHLGAYTIDADGLAHQAMAPGAPAYRPIVETFGQFILNPDKTINRAMLAGIVFANPEALRKLEAITHPVVGQAIDTLVKRAKQRVVVIEAIKLLEGSLAQSVNAVWVVDAKPQTQYARLVGKRKMTPEEAKKRIVTQNPQADKVKAAHVVIRNDGNIEETWKQVQAGWKGVEEQIRPPAAPPAPPRPEVPTATQPPAPKPLASTPQPPQTQPAQQPSAAPQPAAEQKPAAPPPPPAPTPAPSAEEQAPASDEAAPAAPAVDTSGVTVRRGMPSNAETIAGFISRQSGTSVGRMDVIMAFGQKSYLLAETDSIEPAGVIGWQVENLITRADELYVTSGPHLERVVYALIQAVEEASRELQSEVSFIFLATNASTELVQPFLKSGYEITTVQDIKIPAWREAVQEVMQDNSQILTKKLRRDRVLKPI